MGRLGCFNHNEHVRLEILAEDSLKLRSKLMSTGESSKYILRMIQFSMIHTTQTFRNPASFLCVTEKLPGTGPDVPKALHSGFVSREM